MARTEKSLEESLEELNLIVDKLENHELSLDESFQLYKEGMKLLKKCNDSIDKVEKKMIILNEDTEQESN